MNDELENINLESIDLGDQTDGNVNLDEESAAAATIKTHPSRAGMIADVVNHLAKAKDEDLNGYWKSIKKPEVHATSADAAKNVASIAMHKVTKEELEEILGGDDLSEEFANRVATVFEAAVNARVATEVAAFAEELSAKYEVTEEAITEAYATTLEEETAEIVDGLYEQIDSYITHAATTWLEENKVAVTKSLKAELAEDFMNKAATLFAEHNLNVDDDAAEAIEEAYQVAEELEARVNELTEQVIELTQVKIENAKNDAINEAVVGLAATQVDRIRTLSEGIEADDLDTYRAKLGAIVESVSNVKPAAPSGILVEEAPALTTEQIAEETREVSTVDPRMQQYIDATKRGVATA